MPKSGRRTISQRRKEGRPRSKFCLLSFSAKSQKGASIYDVRKIFGFFTFPPFVYCLSAKLGYFLTPTPLSAEWGRHIWKPPSADYLTAQFLKSSFRAMDELCCSGLGLEKDAPKTRRDKCEGVRRGEWVSIFCFKRYWKSSGKKNKPAVVAHLTSVCESAVKQKKMAKIVLFPLLAYGWPLQFQSLFILHWG